MVVNPDLFFLSGDKCDDICVLVNIYKLLLCWTLPSHWTGKFLTAEINTINFNWRINGQHWRYQYGYCQLAIKSMWHKLHVSLHMTQRMWVVQLSITATQHLWTPQATFWLSALNSAFTEPEFLTNSSWKSQHYKSMSPLSSSTKALCSLSLSSMF